MRLMQFTVGKLLYVTAWVSLCIAALTASSTLTTRFGLSQLLCGLTILQIPIRWGPVEKGESVDVEYWVAVCVIALVGAVQAGVGIWVLLEERSHGYHPWAISSHRLITATAIIFFALAGRLAWAWWVRQRSNPDDHRRIKNQYPNNANTEITRNTAAKSSER